MAAELADKTSLIAMSLASKSNNAKIVYLGSMTGLLVTTIISIIFAVLVGNLLPDFISLLAGLLFLILGIQNLFFDEDHEDEETDLVVEEMQSSRLFLYAAGIIALAELGDKSQIFVIAGALVENPLAILLGAITGEGIVLGLSIYFGDKISEKIDPEKLEKIVGIVFLIVGLFLIFSYILE